MTQANAAVPPLTLCELADAKIPDLESFSPYCLKVHRALKVAGLPYTRNHGAFPAVFKKYNPTGQVPVLLIGEEAVADSTAILRRIQALAPGALGEAGDARVSAEAWLWEEFADTALNGFLVAARWADDRNWPGVREAYFSRMPSLLRAIVPGRLRARVVSSLKARDVWRAGPELCWARFGETLDQLDARAPAAGFWLGPAITVADIAIFAQLQGLRNALTAWQQEQIKKRARLSAYLDRVDARSGGASSSGGAKSVVL